MPKPIKVKFIDKFGKEKLAEKVEYTPRTPKFTQYEIDRYNAFNRKYPVNSYLQSMPKELAQKTFFEEYDRRHDPSKIAVNELGKYFDRQSNIYGNEIPPFIQKGMINAVKINPKAATMIPAVEPSPKNYPAYKSDPRVLATPDFFDGRQYRGIQNIDNMFHNAGTAQLMELPDFAKMSGNAGLQDAAALMELPGFERASFKYSPRKDNAPLFPTIYPSHPSEYKTNPTVLATPDFFGPKHYMRGFGHEADKRFRWAGYANDSDMQNEAQRQRDLGFENLKKLFDKIK